ncbi:hypothetical protein PN465_00450 [Nodularia spumigena CS-584]|jgi:hypothetical protein|uniref:hypothetical protein n=1 Tax=Nodularia spumigena TaxID=70799 RepID=UPI0000EACC2B|nr:hypothetical protein [Nodularia spumigena]AHJ31296.1 hypothetical protein NSP_50070 [Nodularia spumigena CCY9414]EAW46702.1 hypothetical protein N9414_08655 [Nodularia spumigena CCY9414]MDB9380716.1 hypothetical protein [Nodularia spumigena CS-584]
MKKNVDIQVVEGFGDEWKRFDYSGFSQTELKEMFNGYYRFGTKLEKRFSRNQIQAMLERSGLENISFSDTPPYWCAVGYKKS